jgi:hypothetical protein
MKLIRHGVFALSRPGLPIPFHVGSLIWTFLDF